MRLGIIILFTFGLLLTATSADELLELSCNTDAQCLKYEQGRCRDGHCLCTEPKSKKTVICKPKDKKLSNIIGGPCTEDHVCAQEHAVCDTKWEQCYCADGYMPSVEHRRCLPRMVALNGTCEQSSQCQMADKFAVCQASSCLCKSKFEQHMGKCLALLDLECTSDTQCSALAAVCLPQHNKCACPHGFVHDQNTTSCVPGVTYGGSCTSTEQCQVFLGAGGMCSNHTCNCRAKYYARNNNLNQDEFFDESVDPSNITCEPIVTFGDYCHEDKDCQIQRMKTDYEKISKTSINMQCMWGECRCREDYIIVEGQVCQPFKSNQANRLANMQVMILFQLVWLIYSRI